MDFRFFSLGNVWAIVTSLTTTEQAKAILNLIESKWDDLVGSMTMKICFPALEYEEWRIITSSDPRNTYCSLLLLILIINMHGFVNQDLEGKHTEI